MGSANHKDRLELKRINGGMVIRTTQGYTEFTGKGSIYYNKEGRIIGFDGRK